MENKNDIKEEILRKCLMRLLDFPIHFRERSHNSCGPDGELEEYVFDVENKNNNVLGKIEVLTGKGRIINMFLTQIEGKGHSICSFIMDMFGAKISVKRFDDPIKKEFNNQHNINGKLKDWQ